MIREIGREAMARSQEQAQEKKPGKNMLWGGRFTGIFELLPVP